MTREDADASEAYVMQFAADEGGETPDRQWISLGIRLGMTVEPAVLTTPFCRLHRQLRLHGSAVGYLVNVLGHCGERMASPRGMGPDGVVESR